MKKQTRNLITILAVLGLIFSGYLIISPLVKNNKIDLYCKNYSVDECSSECVICPPCEVCSSVSCQSKEFCESIGFNETWYNDLNPKKTYCTPEQKKAEVCPEYYSATCGWFDQSIKCLKYPCAQTFANPCFACAIPNIEYYTMGECPK